MSVTGSRLGRVVANDEGSFAHGRVQSHRETADIGVQTDISGIIGSFLDDDSSD
jgi:hypothetical protein